MTFYFAIMIGLMGSTHCIAMCGGLMTVMSIGHSKSGHSEATAMQKYRHSILLNLGRVTTYILLGMVFAVFLGSLARAIDLPQWGNAMRVLIAVAMILAGIQILFKRSMFKYFEIFGKKLFGRSSQLVKHILPMKHWSASYLLGMVWGLLPCGLIYSLLLMAMATNDAMSAGKIMLGFGLGTLPALLATGSLAIHFKKYIQSKWLNKTYGAIALMSGMWILFAPYLIDMSVLQTNFYWVNLVMCH